MVSIRQVVTVLVATGSLARAEPVAGTQAGATDLVSWAEALDAEIQLQLHQAELGAEAKGDGLQSSCIRHSLDLVPRLRQTASSALASVRTAAKAGDKPTVTVQVALLDAAAKESQRVATSVGRCLGARAVTIRAVVSSADAASAADPPPTPSPDTAPPPAKVERKQQRIRPRDRDFGRCIDLLGVIGCATVPLEYVGFASPHFP